jgi:hypothetical protein
VGLLHFLFHKMRKSERRALLYGMEKRKAKRMTEVEIRLPTVDQVRLERGYRTMREVCEVLDVEYGTLRYHIKMERCPAPSVLLSGDRKRRRRYYAPEDLVILRSYFSSRERCERPAK